MRFPEFEGEWTRYRVSDLLEFFSTNSLSWDQLKYEQDGIKNLHYGLIHKGMPTIVDTSFNKLPTIKTDSLPKNYTLCIDGDVAFADASEDTNDVAKAIEFVNCNGSKIICGLHTIHGRDKLGITELGFKGYAFLSPVFHNQIRRIAQGTKVYSISQKNFHECYIGVPSKDEQQKIATLLSLIDERISTQNKIIEKLESSIKGLRELLVKHNNEWCKIKLSECCVIKSGLSLPQNDFFKGYPVTRIETISQRKINLNKVGYVLTNTDISSYKLHYGDILFSNINSVSHIGKTAFVDEDYDLYHGMNLLRLISNESIITPYFLYLILNTNRAVNSFQSTCNQAVSQASINQTELSKFTISIPSIAKQNIAIALMQLMNNWIYTELKILESYNKQKKYCLKNMFI